MQQGLALGEQKTSKETWDNDADNERHGSVGARGLKSRATLVDTTVPKVSWYSSCLEKLDACSTTGGHPFYSPPNSLFW